MGSLNGLIPTEGWLMGWSSNFIYKASINFLFKKFGSQCTIFASLKFQVEFQSSLFPKLILNIAWGYIYLYITENIFLIFTYKYVYFKRPTYFLPLIENKYQALHFFTLF